MILKYAVDSNYLRNLNLDKAIRSIKERSLIPIVWENFSIFVDHRFNPEESHMLKTIFSFTFLLSLGYAGSAQKAKQSNKTSAKSEVKFLDNIQVEVAPSS